MNRKRLLFRESKLHATEFDNFSVFIFGDFLFYFIVSLFQYLYFEKDQNKKGHVSNRRYIANKFKISFRLKKQTGKNCKKKEGNAVGK